MSAPWSVELNEPDVFWVQNFLGKVVFSKNDDIFVGCW
jgi:hypothetical protein